MKSQKYKEWTIDFSTCRGWLNIRAARDIDAGTRRIRNKAGEWITIPATRARYALAWNGERFAEGPELERIRKFHRGLFEAIRAAVGGKL